MLILDTRLNNRHAYYSVCIAVEINVDSMISFLWMLSRNFVFLPVSVFTYIKKVS